MSGVEKRADGFDSMPPDCPGLDGSFKEESSNAADAMKSLPPGFVKRIMELGMLAAPDRRRWASMPVQEMEMTRRWAPMLLLTLALIAIGLLTAIICISMRRGAERPPAGADKGAGLHAR